MLYTIGPAANIQTFEGVVSAAAVRCSAYWMPAQWIVSNDSSATNLGIRFHGSASDAWRELTLGGGESLSIYIRQRAIEVSCNTSGAAGGASYRVWAFG